MAPKGFYIVATSRRQPPHSNPTKDPAQLTLVGQSGCSTAGHQSAGASASSRRPMAIGASR
ncbi:hypothetical protein OAO87_02585 [bacterium]|nr:hypothetical protein [bacterium]